MQLGIEKRMMPHVPWPLIATAMIISLLGLWNLASASRPPSSVWTTQALYLGVSLTAAVVVSLLEAKGSAS